VEPGDVRQVGVVGAGLMGSGIVEVAARAGADVRFVEGSAELVERGRSAVERSIGRAVERGKLDAGEADAVLGRIGGTVDLEELSGADLAIEAATEDLDAKRTIFRTLGRVTRPRWSSPEHLHRSHRGLALASGRPDKVVGMHFFNLPPVMALRAHARAHDLGRDARVRAGLRHGGPSKDV
jgi:3-hydroxybutyryl-CoA dehydrogenase